MNNGQYVGWFGVWRVRKQVGFLCLLMGLCPWLGAAAEAPRWLTLDRFEMLLEEVPLSPEEMDEALTIAAEALKSGEFPLRSDAPDSSSKGSERFQEGVIEKGAHHKTLRVEVDRKAVLKGREERKKELTQIIGDFEREFGREVSGLSLDTVLPESLSKIERHWLALGVERKELEDEIRRLKDAEEVLYQEYTQVETGENYWSQEKGQWRPSKERIEIIDGIGVARQGQQRVLFAPDLSEEGSVDISTPDGKRLKATVLGLAYVDAASGEDVVIANLKSTVGELAGGNQMIYRDAFDGLEADVVYTYRKSGLEQDVILRSKIVSPAELGLNPDTTRLEVLTEWFDAPEPIIQVQTLRQHSGVKSDGDAFAEPALVDEALSFGAVEIGLGRAFWRGDGQNAGRKEEKKLKDLAISANGLPVGLEEDIPKLMYPMAKHWLVQEGRSVLCEGVEYRSIESLLDQLPEPKKKRAALPRLDVDSPVSMLADGRRERRLPMVLKATREFPVDRSIRLAQADTLSALQAPGLVLDYMTLNPATDFHFESGRTYRVTGNIVLRGRTVIEGGAVIKFERSTPSKTVQLRCLGNVVCETGPYNPAVFTAVGDGQYGSRLSYTPITGYYAQNALWVEPGGAPVKIEYLRIKHAINGVFFENSQGAKLRHSQLLGCRHPVAARYQDLKVENVLIDGSGRYAFWASSGDPNRSLAPGQETRIHAEHVTVHDGPWLAYNTHWNGQLLRGQTEYKNSLLVNVNGANVGNRFYPGDIGGIFTQSPFLPNVAQESVFQSVGFGNFYLPPESPYRDVGGSTVDPLLALELRERSTTAPQHVQGSVSGVLTPRSVKDTGVLDLGYHYDPIDYGLAYALVRGDVAVGAGTIVACTGITGMYLYPWRSSDSISVEFRGKPGDPVLCVGGDTVQEQSLFNWMTRAMSVSRNWQNSSITAQYTDFYGLSKHYVVDTSYSAHVGDLDVRHSRIFNASLWVRVNPGHRMSFFNCLFQTRGYLSFGGGGAFDLQHSLIRDSNWVGFGPDAAGTDGWRIDENVFDESRVTTSVLYAPNLSYGRNVAIMRAFWWWPGELIRVPRPFPWQDGPLGKFYQPNTNNPLLDAASVTADSGPIDRRLSHHTVRADLVPEGSSLIDFGYHYLATDTNGHPLDDNLDGIPNYIQDTNANGLVDNGEVDWRRPPLDPEGDEDGDGLTNYEETQLFAQFNLDPHNPDSDGDGISDAGEDSDGDLISNRIELRITFSNPVDPVSLDPGRSIIDSQYLFVAPAVGPSVGQSGFENNQSPPEAGDVPMPAAAPAQGQPHLDVAIVGDDVLIELNGSQSDDTFDIYCREAVGSEAFWKLVARGEPGQQEYRFPLPSNNFLFFAGFSAKDYDDDSVPDGYECFVALTEVTGEKYHDADLDRDNDQVPLGAELLLRTDPFDSDNALTLDELSSGQVVSGVVRIELGFSTLGNYSDRVVLLVDGNDNEPSVVQKDSQSNDWILLWDTSSSFNGRHSLQLKIQYRRHSGIVGWAIGPAVNVNVSNRFTFDPLSGRIDKSLTVSALVNNYDSGNPFDVVIDFFDDSGDFIGSWGIRPQELFDPHFGATDTWVIGAQWDLLAAHSKFPLDKNIRGEFFLVEKLVGLPEVGAIEILGPQPDTIGEPVLTRTFVYESPIVGDGFVVAWGWDKEAWKWGGDGCQTSHLSTR